MIFNTENTSVSAEVSSTVSWVCESVISFASSVFSELFVCPWATFSSCWVLSILLFSDVFSVCDVLLASLSLIASLFCDDDVSAEFVSFVDLLFILSCLFSLIGVESFLSATLLVLDLFVLYH